jgi:hypothetical protein
MRNSKAMLLADSGLILLDLASFQSNFSSVDFIRAQFIFKPSGIRRKRSPLNTGLRKTWFALQSMTV